MPLSPDEIRARNAERMRRWRQEHKDDPEWHARLRVYSKAAREKHRDSEEWKERQRRACRKWYADRRDDPEWRERQRGRGRKKDKTRQFRVSQDPARQEKRRSYIRQYVKVNREKIRAQQRARYAANHEKAAEKYRRYRDKHADELRAKWREYARSPEGKANLHRHRAKRKAVPGKFTAAEWRAKLAEFGGCCAFCGTNVNIQIDHIVPLARGGSNAIDNIQPLCKLCNSRKGAK